MGATSNDPWGNGDDTGAHKLNVVIVEFCDNAWRTKEEIEKADIDRYGSPSRGGVREHLESLLPNKKNGVVGYLEKEDAKYRLTDHGRQTWRSGQPG
ncbi:MAG TPA: hypothetical protein VG125_25835 [Pirellulales bacterium]|jgi:hypothetical protein|nr:hypothetical protein [Pirellulales bacterium]